MLNQVITNSCSLCEITSYEFFYDFDDYSFNDCPGRLTEHAIKNAYMSIDSGLLEIIFTVESSEFFFQMHNVGNFDISVCVS